MPLLRPCAGPTEVRWRNPKGNDPFSSPKPLSLGPGSKLGASLQVVQKRRRRTTAPPPSQPTQPTQLLAQRLRKRGARAPSAERLTCGPCRAASSRGPPPRTLDSNERFLQRLMAETTDMSAHIDRSGEYFAKAQLRSEALLQTAEEMRAQQGEEEVARLARVRRFKPTRIPLWVPDTWTVVCEQRKDDRPPPPPPKPSAPPPGSKRAKELAAEKKRPPKPKPKPKPPVVAPVITEFLFYPPGGLNPVRSVAEALERGLLRVSDEGALQRCRHPNHVADNSFIPCKRDL